VAPVESRPFEMERDADALIRVNNRAFASHPDPGGMPRQRLADAAAQPWFDADGIRLLDDPDRPGALAGFCWTKIHEPVSDGQPRLGEIYAIGIDPDHHGKGLGVPMTAAGLQWLADQGLTDGMLYVEADNEPALRTYDRLGFHHHRTDRAWQKAIGG
jgi:mycothiol synthase